MIEAGSADLLGAHVEGGGVNFSVFAPEAVRLELCLFDASGAETSRFDLPEQSEGIWHGFVPGLGAGQAYGFRAHGRYVPVEGLRFNAHKLLLDPYAKALTGRLEWCDAIFDFDRNAAGEALRRCRADSAPHMPKSVVAAPPRRRIVRPDTPWSRMLIYELNVRGFSLKHPAVDAAARGRFAALESPAVLEHLKALGVTTVELMPVHAFADEEFLVRRGLRNFWGYNSFAFFAPEPRYLGPGGLAGLTRVIDTLHDAGIEVVLDVVYNHTAEGGRLGPTLSFRGLANSAYYRLVPHEPEEYINDTGCGNTINTDHPIVRRLIRDSLRYWVTEIGVDGFRFDLATILGRTPAGFTRGHELFREIRSDAVLRDVKLIAEPWDVGPGGYQLGGFPEGWAEWNDRFRDSVRRYWRRDEDTAPELARRIHGSADIFEPGGRGPEASVNFVASHDGFTTADLVSFSERHNEANGEGNRDGHAHNFSCNHGVEGDTRDPKINAIRRRHRLNLLATVLLSQGTPMLLAGDEFGNSQLGNNNAYAQDNEIGWLDWSGLGSDPSFFDEIRKLARIRRQSPLLRQAVYRHSAFCASTGHREVEWFDRDGKPISEAAWRQTSIFGMLLSRSGDPDSYRATAMAVAVLFNPLERDYAVTLPAIAARGSWSCRYSSAGHAEHDLRNGSYLLAGCSIACLSFD